jgi:ribulose-phosphate 3-epimerase
MGAIVPAILPQSRQDLEDKLSKLAGLADSVQIDVVDGRFASPACWPYSGGSKELARMAAGDEMLPHYGEMKFDIDLMAENPEQVTGSWVSLGASRMTIHAEATTALGKLVAGFQSRYGHEKGFIPDLISLGLAIGADTPLGLIEPFAGQIDYVQLMGIRRIGVQGQPFDDRAVKRVRDLKRKYPKLAVQVDGGVSKTTAPALLSAGADRLIVGSALWTAPNLADEIAAFNDLAQRYGTYE